MRKSKIFDVIIIGAGTAGLAAQRLIHKKTKNYLVVDSGPLGTTCARVGCMPSKALIESANFFHEKQKMAKVGVQNTSKLHVNQKQFLKHVKDLNDIFADSMVEETLKIGKRLILGKAQFIDQETIRVNQKLYRAKKFILATGAHAIIPEELENLKAVLWTSDDIFKMKKLPKSLGVVGSGAIGFELSQALSRLGVKVTVFGFKRGLVGIEEPEIRLEAEKLFSQEINLFEDEVISGTHKNGKFQLKTKTKSYSFEKVLVATGRHPNTENLGLENFKIAYGKKGNIQFNPKTGRIKNTCLYVAGDVSDYANIQHEASLSGRIAGLNVLIPKDQNYERFVSLKIAFTDPQIVHVGQTKNSLDLRKIKYQTITINFEKQSRARIQMNNKGKVFIYIDPKTKKILGAEIFIPNGEHLGHYLALAVTHKMTVKDILKSPYYHPVVLEGLSAALKRA